MTVTELHQKDITTLTELAYELGLEGVSSLRKQELIFRILRAETAAIAATSAWMAINGDWN